MIKTVNIVSVSGGKDSTALYCWAISQWGRNGFLAVFADTGHEHPVTLNYLRNLPEMAKGPGISTGKGRLQRKTCQEGHPAYAEPVPGHDALEGESALRMRAILH